MQIIVHISVEEVKVGVRWFNNSNVKTDTEAYGFLVILTVTTTAQLEMIADDLTQVFPLLAFQQCGAVSVPVCVAVVQ